MCVNCMNGGFHQEQTIDEQKSLSDGLLNRDWFNYADQTGVRDDGKFTFYMSDDLPKKVRGFVRELSKRLIRSLNTQLKKQKMRIRQMSLLMMLQTMIIGDQYIQMLLD